MSITSLLSPSGSSVAENKYIYENKQNSRYLSQYRINKFLVERLLVSVVEVLITSLLSSSDSSEAENTYTILISYDILTKTKYF